MMPTVACRLKLALSIAMLGSASALRAPAPTRVPSTSNANPAVGNDSYVMKVLKLKMLEVILTLSYFPRQLSFRTKATTTHAATSATAADLIARRSCFSARMRSWMARVDTCSTCEV
jgi:hypothetical protein